MDALVDGLQKHGIRGAKRGFSKAIDMMKAVPKEVIEPMIARIPLRRLGPAGGYCQRICVPGLR